MSEFAGTDALTIDVDDDGVITVAGEVDMAGGPLLEAVIVRHENDTPLTLDVSGVSFIDSSGLRSLLEASRRAKSRNTVVRLLGVGPEVARLLDITGTTDQFEVTLR